MSAPKLNEARPAPPDPFPNVVKSLAQRLDTPVTASTGTDNATNLWRTNHSALTHITATSLDKIVPLREHQTAQELLTCFANR